MCSSLRFFFVPDCRPIDVNVASDGVRVFIISVPPLGLNVSNDTIENIKSINQLNN